MIGTIRQRAGVLSYFLDGVEVTKEMYDSYFVSKLFPQPTAYTREEIEAFVRSHDEAELDPELKVRLPRGYPIKSVACGTTPKGVKKAMAEAERRGCPTEFTPDGLCVLRDAAHRRQYLRVMGLHDRNSFNGY